jgi:ribonuclease HI
MISKVVINADGGSRGNPGRAAIGLVIRDGADNVLLTHKEVIGIATNNEAEYRSLIKSLELASKYTDNEVVMNMDSEFVVRQMSGRYSLKAKNLVPLFRRAKDLEKRFKAVSYNHVLRGDSRQAKADMLVNKALDGL